MKKAGEIALELKALGADFGNETNTIDMFHIPEGYFQQFPEEMTAIVKAMNIADVSLNITAGKEGPFIVPDGYFSQFAENTLLSIKAIEHTAHSTNYSWQDAEKKNAYSIPEGYFAQFETQLFHKIFEQETAVSEEIETLSPLLAGLKKEQPFSLPTGYFNSDAFARQVQEQQPQVKAIEHPAVRSIKWARWAAAAAVIAIFMLGGLHYFNPSANISKEASFERALAQIPDENIKEWLSNHMDEADINNLGGSVANLKTISTKPSLNNFSEKEIKDYLETELW